MRDRVRLISGGVLAAVGLSITVWLLVPFMGCCWWGWVLVCPCFQFAVGQ